MKRTFAFELRCLPLLGMLVGVLFAGASGCAGDLDSSLYQPGTAGTQGQSGTSGGAGTMGTAGTGGGQPPACDAVAMVFNAGAIKCTLCHSKDGAAGIGAGLDLESPGLAARLVGQGPQKMAIGSAACMTGTKPYLVAHSNPPDGLLLDKVDPQKFATLANCGTQMPQGGTALSSAQLSCLSAWAAGVIAGTVQ